MRIRVTIFVRERPVKVLLAKKGMQWGSQRWLAAHLGISEEHMSNILAGRQPVTPRIQKALVELFRGMSHKPGGRLKWDDLFQCAVSGPQGAA